LLAACAAPGTRAPARQDAPEPAQRRANSERRYAIWLGGAQVGTAREVESWSAAGVIVRRTEAMRFLRGDVPVALATSIEIAADAALVPSRVSWTEQAQASRHGEAVRDATGWTVTDDAGVRRLPDRAIPAELAPLLVRRDGRFVGPVFLPARGFVVGAGRIEPVAPGRLVARLTFEAGTAAEATAEATIDLGDDGMPIRVVDGDGVIAMRVTADEAAQPYVPVDLIAATAIAVSGVRSHRLHLDGDLAVPAVPGQRTHAVPDGAIVELSARLGGGLPPGTLGADRTREIVALVRRVRGRIVPDLAADPTSARTAAAATAGDCTTFALAYTALASERAIPTRVVTGFRIDGDRLIRHRWAVSWTGRAWIAIDAAFGAVPAGGDLVGLAIHDADDLGLVAGEAALTHVRAATWK
jgi:transglutaminase-like putative cysteine protease